MLQWLFGVDPELLFAGDITLQYPVVGFIAVALIVCALVYWWGPKSLTPPPSALAEWLPWGLRCASLVLLLWVLFQPHLTVERQEPIRGRIAVLIDGSQSMSITNERGRPEDQIASALHPQTGSVARALRERFDTQFFQFGRELSEAGTELGFDQNASRLARSLKQLTQRSDANALTAVVVLSDGAIDDASDLPNTINHFRARSIPVHAVNMTERDSQPDIEISNITLPDQVLRGTNVLAEVTLSHRRVVDREIELIVEEADAIVSVTKVVLDERSARTEALVPLFLEGAGPRQFTFRIAPLAGETLTANNRRTEAIYVREGPLRVLHFEGNPRFEVKFLRRALRDDRGISVASLVRTAENKFYRLGIDNPEELATGFPDTKEALYHYDVLVLGNVPASMLTPRQLALIKDFVAERGGGLVVLGGRTTYAAGGYFDSPIADILPVQLGTSRDAEPVDVQVLPSDQAQADVIRHFGALGSDPDVWARLPPLTVVNPLRELKPGAQVVLRGVSDKGESLIVLSTQRFGRGHVAALPVRNTWRWQMHSTIAVDDATHETLWRNLLRSVAPTDTGRIRLLGPERAPSGDTVTFEIRTLDRLFAPSATDAVSIKVTTPLGHQQTPTVVPDVTRPGRATFSITLGEDGDYEINASLNESPESSTSAPSNDGLITTRRVIHASMHGGEYIRAGTSFAQLNQLATQTGGKTIDATDAQQLPELINDAMSTQAVTQRYALGSAPIWLVLLLALVCIEWILRRRQSLP